MQSASVMVRPTPATMLMDSATATPGVSLASSVTGKL